MRLLRFLILLVGVYACSTAVLMVKKSTVDPVLLSAYRLLVAAVVLTPLWIRSLRAQRRGLELPDLGRVLVPAVFLALHFISWIVGARMTLAANASLIVNLVPVAMPFLMFALSREVIHRGEVAGTALAMGGMLLLAGADFRLSPTTFMGDAVCFGSMILFASYLAFGRKNRHVPDIWLFVVPLYYAAGLLCLGAALATGRRVEMVPPAEIRLILGLGIVPTVIGHSSLLYSMKHLRPQTVAICNLGQFVFAGITAFFLFHEAPHRTFYAATALLLAGAVLAIRSAPAPEDA
jgi:drug/metabolite transporter (DMT)-like permease